jgi:hypothetical protein
VGTVLGFAFDGNARPSAMALEFSPLFSHAEMLLVHLCDALSH